MPDLAPPLEDRPLPGSGLALASLLGLGGAALGSVLWFVSGSMLAGVAVGLLAGPAALLVDALLFARRERRMNTPAGRFPFLIFPQFLAGAIHV